MKKIILLLITSALILVGCKTKTTVSANYPHETECLGSELDGSVTLKSWGKGKDRNDAIEQAKKEAVNAVLFLGIRSGNKQCDSRPLLNAPNIRENKSEYFNTFFKDGGNYKNFTSNQDESFGKKEKEKGTDGEVMYGYIIRVMRSDLKKQMITDGILNN
ncbi:hypothetical protein SL053_000012 [Flavobacterium psychrophilum]|jgi:hypothetical protein|uniref:hypothetical protein n=1 Tax=Flavobacterium psychrophilum TaxID=96345 RepID=UPI0004E7C4F0|nr:hypothetical protein [Flavobacterium psychrophilum]AIJ36598.1 hypothetical protein FPSM_00103 [Flavobacterium psychrophilum]AIN70629.1 hypothetical protein FPG101_00575 [Flavobacterium psychrophilum FPG101]AIN73040.1 hypothetical protein FPG3_00555 [Flavobacterium psychrophilum FPG3]EKT2069240.1 hypothetical protein [Flavobacterium psychrophilum]EKT2071337.1 hypothetical protein [Flavobacterium psychrophilum]